MEKLVVISDEPALADALADALPEYAVVRVGVREKNSQVPDAQRASDIRMIVADIANPEDISSLGTNVPVLTVARPARLRELLYTIRERLQAQTHAIQEEIAMANGYTYSLRERVFTHKNESQRISLTEKEAELFIKLIENKDKITTRDFLLKQIWGYSEEIDTHTLQTHIYRLRGKLRQMGSDYDVTATDEGGYKLKIPE